MVVTPRFLTIVQTKAFEATSQGVLTSLQIDALELMLAQTPEIGDEIPGTGGIRKLRVAASGRGKRGGARIIYFHYVRGQKVYLLFVYAKNDQEDLTSAQRKALRLNVQRIKEEG